MIDRPEIARGDAGDALAAAELCAGAMPDPWSAGAIRSELALPGASLWLARVGGELAGMLLARRVLEVVSLHLVAAAPLQRRRGVGRALVHALVAAERDADRIELEVRARNAAAIALYRSEGFREVGRRPRYYRGAEDAVLFTRTLDPPSQGDRGA